jgi:20S proteasome alpha/beta subunit
MREFLEKNYREPSGKDTVKLALRALLEGSTPTPSLPCNLSTSTFIF